MIGKINDNIAAGNIPKNLKLAGPIIEVMLLYLPNISQPFEYELKSFNKHDRTRQVKSLIQLILTVQTLYGVYFPLTPVR